MFYPLDYDQIETLKKQITSLESCFSEYSSANLYLFRKIHNYQIDTNSSCLTGVDRKKRNFLMPLSFLPFQKKELPAVWLDFLKSKGTLYPLTQNQAQKIKTTLSLDCEIFYDEDDSDYLYERESIQTLKGRHLSSKRNLIHQLTSQHPNCRLEPLKDSDKTGIEELLFHWQEHHGDEGDLESFREALEKRDLLNLQGWTLFCENQVIGVSLGEIQKERWLYHFAKTLPHFKGAGALLYQETAKALSSSIKEINMEQDLGQLGLRQAKHSFLPKELLHKWRVKLKTPPSL